MPIFSLTDKIEFPPVELADSIGILARGGDLSLERMLEAYSHGIFPWFGERQPILWWSPDPRYVIFSENLHISRSMRKILRQHRFEIRYDTQFRKVLEECANIPRKHESGTWLTDDLIEAYVRLHKYGVCHSAEAWQGDRLVGGLFGVCIGRYFSGESMFTRVSNASKAAFLTLAQKLFSLGFRFIDCQTRTSHLISLGATAIPRTKFMELLQEALTYETLLGNWGKLPEFANEE